jgi:hypothetical protein
VIDARRLGKSQAELVAIVLPYVSNLAKKYRPVASSTIYSKFVSYFNKILNRFPAYP